MTTTRRQVLAAFSTLPFTRWASAQPSQRPRRVAWLTAFPRKDIEAGYKALRSELEGLGWFEGRNITLLEPQSSEGRTDRLPALAADLVAAAPDLIVVQSAPATRALMALTTTIPIVMNGVGDPVGYGIVRSYTEPGGNVTGTSYLVEESSNKTLELLKEIAPRITAFTLFVNPTNEAAAQGIRSLQKPSSGLGLRLHSVEVRTAADFEAAFANIRQARTEAIFLWPEALVRSQRMAIGRFAADHRLPLAMVGSPQLLDAGGLLTYGPSTAQYPGLVARYVDRILRGATPGKLPIEQPLKFDLGINLANAKALGVDVPASVIARADEVIR